jgi:ABC-type transporter Mla MlaB component
MNPSAADTVRLALGPELGIVQAAEVQGQWLSQLEAHAAQPLPWELACAGVQEIDSAGLQLLISLRHALHERGQSLSLIDPSATLLAALASFGLSTSLECL